MYGETGLDHVDITSTLESAAHRILPRTPIRLLLQAKAEMSDTRWRDRRIQELATHTSISGVE